MIQRKTPLKRTGLRQPTLAEVIAFQNKPRKPLPRAKRAPALVGRKAKREEAALALGRALVIQRSGGRCEGPWIVGVHPAFDHGATHVHHIVMRSRGGSHHPSNLLHACDRLHRWIHDFPEAATEMGLLASRGARREVV